MRPQGVGADREHRHLGTTRSIWNLVARIDAFSVRRRGGRRTRVVGSGAARAHTALSCSRPVRSGTRDAELLSAYLKKGGGMLVAASADVDGDVLREFACGSHQHRDAWRGGTWRTHAADVECHRRAASGMR